MCLFLDVVLLLIIRSLVLHSKKHGSQLRIICAAGPRIVGWWCSLYWFPQTLRDSLADDRDLDDEVLMDEYQQWQEAKEVYATGKAADGPAARPRKKRRISTQQHLSAMHSQLTSVLRGKGLEQFLKKDEDRSPLHASASVWFCCCSNRVLLFSFLELSVFLLSPSPEVWCPFHCW